MAPDNSRPQRRKLQNETLLGFVGFFAFLAVLQAVVNIFSPEPAVWPALLAAFFLGLTWWVWYRG